MCGSLSWKVVFYALIWALGFSVCTLQRFFYKKEIEALFITDIGGQSVYDLQGFSCMVMFEKCEF